MKEKTPWQDVLDSIPRKKEKPGWDTFAIKATAYALSLPITGTINLGFRLWDEFRSFPGRQPDPLPPRPVSDKMEGCEQFLKDGLPKVFEGLNKQFSEQFGKEVDVPLPPPYFVREFHNIIDEVFALCNPQTEKKQDALLDALGYAFYLLSFYIPPIFSPFFAPLEQAKNIDPWLMIEPFLYPHIRETGATKKFEEYIEPYIVNGVPTKTPFDILYKLPVSYDLTEHKTKHWSVFARTGSGKTELLSSVVLQHLKEPDPPAIIVLDAHGDLIRKLESLQLFEASDRLVVVDCEASPALSMFDVPQLDSYAKNQIIELYSYIFSTKETDLTARQGTAFRYIISAVMQKPGANIIDLLHFVDEVVPKGGRSQFWPYIQKLDDIARSYFENRFYAGDGNAKGTREQISQRLHSILADDAFRDMFSARENKLNLYQCIQDRKVVLVNASGLADPTTFLRYIILLCLQAAFQRRRLPENERHPALLFIDEARPLLQNNDTITRILTECRKFGVYLRVFSQQYGEIDASVKAAIATNTEVKLTGGLNYSDATSLAREMHTTTEQLLQGGKSGHTDFHYNCFIQDVTPKPILITFPHGILDREPKISDPSHARALRAALQSSRSLFNPGDRVQVTLNGADLYPDGVVVREVRQHEGEWFVFVEGSTTGIPEKDVRLFSATTDRTKEEKEDSAHAASEMLPPAHAAQPFKPDEDFR